MDSIIFDLDGTIWDPIDTVLDSWNKAVQRTHPGEKTMTRKDLESIMGLQIHDIGKKLFPHWSEEEQRSVLNECFDSEVEFLKKQGGRLYPNVEPVLQQLAKKYRLFIVSNCQEGYIETFYDSHRLERYFEDFENPGRTGLSKGENIRLVIDRNDLESPVYVGDTEGDFQAARFAGVPFVYAKYGFGDVSGYDEVVEEFKELGMKF
ncbi:HAD family hydrolase [Halobacillus litoralis]|uniref:HAD family hydrolase n=1 Tax=Halobacillus litoralis TaxID=45668 RepID=UPI001CD6AAC3|nr:HAD family hydrolase [Halobacillus litoralis]MCA0969317.1 HAD family hydrolase [Halobacillus litoralis]